MKRKSFVIILACLGVISAFWSVKRGLKPPPKVDLIVAPSEKPYPKAIAASGMIESLGDNVAIGGPVSGVIQDVYVKVGHQVKKGDPLFKLDTRELELELKIAEAKENIALADHHLINTQLIRLHSVQDLRAVSQEEVHLKENTARVALATLHHMVQEKEKIIGLLDRLTVRSPMDGIILQKNIREGEYLLASNIDRPPIIMGEIDHLQIRVDIDEHNASHFVRGSEATAYPKNRPNCPIPLTFARIEPYVIPKISLTGSSREKVDTRVLQVIYTFSPSEDVALYVGQQVDVYIKQDLTQAL